MGLFIILVLGVLVFLGLALCGVFWEAHRSGEMISRWAADQGYEVIEKKAPIINLGPFRWENPRGRTFYHITVRDSEGQTRAGWVSCGAEWLGLLSNKVVIRWDEGEARSAPPRLRQVDEGVWPPPPMQ
jgi:hypothetical protein